MFYYSIFDISNAILNSKKYLLIEFKVFNELNDKSTIVIFIKNVNIINKLKIKMLLNNNIFESKNIVFDIDKNIATINNC